MRIGHWLRYHIKLLLAASLFYSGALFLVLRWRFRRSGVVLLYHRVLPEAECAQSFSSRAIIVSPATFERHLRFLRRHFEVLGPEEFREWLLNGRVYSRPPCLITFDDGWKDNLTHARPLLKALSIPAVIFLPTDYIGTGKAFWQERLSRLLFRLGRQPALRQHPLVARHGLADLFAARHSELADRASALARSFKNSKSEVAESIIVEVTAALAGNDDPTDVDTYLSWDDVQTLRPDGITFGSHTVSHRILTQIDPVAVTEELTESRRVLEQRLNAPVHFLAYPNGNHDAETCKRARQAGYELAFTTIPGVVTRGDDPMSLRRINIHDGAHRHLPLFCTSILGVL
jgi:peptidoglycan/xylan/chitin deacetylase (PgdA/CDA1 family)